QTCIRWDWQCACEAYRNAMATGLCGLDVGTVDVGLVVLATMFITSTANHGLTGILWEPTIPNGFLAKQDARASTRHHRSCVHACAAQPVNHHGKAISARSVHWPRPNTTRSPRPRCDPPNVRSKSAVRVPTGWQIRPPC